MRTICVSWKTLCSTCKCCKWRYLLFHRKRLEPRVLPWQQHNRYHLVSFVMYFSGAKFEEHCSNISGDILDSAFLLFECNHLWRHHFPHLQNTKTRISLKIKRYFEKGKRHSSLLWKAFQISGNHLLLHRHFNWDAKVWRKVGLSKINWQIAEEN